MNLRMHRIVTGNRGLAYRLPAQARAYTDPRKGRTCSRGIPRLENEEADALTNGEFHHFRAERRIPVDLEKLEFINELFAEGEKYVKELE